jgi:hypothetical protein
MPCYPVWVPYSKQTMLQHFPGTDFLLLTTLYGIVDVSAHETVLHCLLCHRMRRLVHSYGHRLKVRRHLGKVVSLAIVGFYRYHSSPHCRSPHCRSPQDFSQEFRALLVLSRPPWIFATALVLHRIVIFLQESTKQQNRLLTVDLYK